MAMIDVENRENGFVFTERDIYRRYSRKCWRIGND